MEFDTAPTHFSFRDYDGILGLGFACDAKNNVKPVFDNMAEQGVLKELAFSFYMNKFVKFFSILFMS